MLTPKQQTFVAEYVKDGNATRAATAAGYSAKTATEIGAENLRKPQIAQAIAEKQAEQLERLDVKAERVKEELARVSFLDPMALFDEVGNYKAIKDMPADV